MCHCWFWEMLGLESRPFSVKQPSPSTTKSRMRSSLGNLQIHSRSTSINRFLFYNCKTSINLFKNTCICNIVTIWIWNWMFFLHEEKKICTDFCWLLFFRPNGQRWNVFFHFTGSVPGSNCLESMLKRLLIEMEVLNVRCSFK